MHFVFSTGLNVELYNSSMLYSPLAFSSHCISFDCDLFSFWFQSCFENQMIHPFSSSLAFSFLSWTELKSTATRVIRGAERKESLLLFTSARLKAADLYSDSQVNSREREREFSFSSSLFLFHVQYLDRIVVSLLPAGSCFLMP